MPLTEFELGAAPAPDTYCAGSGFERSGGVALEAVVLLYACVMIYNLAHDYLIPAANALQKRLGYKGLYSLLSAVVCADFSTPCACAVGPMTRRERAY
jgi:hypothetical protein